MSKSTIFGAAAWLAIAVAGCAFGPPAMAQDVARPGPMGDHRSAVGEAGPMGGRGRWVRRMREFALVFPAPDRNLSGPDVQKIAEAFLLFNGNHSWKVTEVKEEADKVSFALATADNTAIAHFTMDRHSGRPERVD